MAIEIGYLETVFDWNMALNTINLLIVFIFSVVMLRILIREVKKHGWTD